MRFLVFNLVVFGALFYLFTADRGDIHAVADRAHAAVDRIEDAAARTVDKVNGIIDRKTRDLPRLREEPRQPFDGGRFESVTSSVEDAAQNPESGKAVAEATPRPAAPEPSSETVPPVTTSPVVSSPPEQLISPAVSAESSQPTKPSAAEPSGVPAPKEAPKPSPITVSTPTQIAAADRTAEPAVPASSTPPAPPGEMAEVKSQPSTAADRVTFDGQEIPARWIPPLAVNKPTYEFGGRALPVPEFPAAKTPTTTAEAAAEPAPEPRTEAPPRAVATNGNPEIAIADGAELMSPGERRLELFSLAEEMELLFLEKLGE